MEITSFILGVCAVIVLLMIVGTSVNYMSVKHLKKEILQLKQHIEGVEQLLNQQNEEVIRYADKLHNNHDGEMNKLYSYTDSRVDKVINELERIKRNYIKEY